MLRVADRERLMSEFRRAVRATPSGNTDKSEEAAVEDFAAYLDRLDGQERRRQGQATPDCSRIPTPTPERLEDARRRVLGLIRDGDMPAARGLAEEVADGAVRVMAEVVLPKLAAVPGQCKAGRAGILARDMQDRCVRRRWGPVRDWLLGNGVLKLTGRHSVRLGRTRTYRVNVPIVLWLLGCRREDLAWTWTRPEAPELEGGGTGVPHSC